MGVGLFPRFLPSVTDLEFSLTIVNASATERAFLTVLIIARIGVPIVLGYTISVYRIFKGKVWLGEHSY